MKNDESIFIYLAPFRPSSGSVTGLVSGKILRIHSLCSNEDDISRRMKDFYARFLFCVYQHYLLVPVFTKGITEARAFIKRSSVWRCVSYQEKDMKCRVFFHLTYYPGDSTSEDLQHQWRQHLLHPPCERPIWTLKNKYNIPICIKFMCVAYSRPKNLGNIFMYCKVDRIYGPSMSSYM